MKPRDVYDMAAAIDLKPSAAADAAKAASSKRASLLRRLDELAVMDQALLLSEILPYYGPLRHSSGMVAKVREFLVGQPHEAFR